MEEKGCANGKRADAFGVRGDRQESTFLHGYIQTSRKRFLLPAFAMPAAIANAKPKR